LFSKLICGGGGVAVTVFETFFAVEFAGCAKAGIAALASKIVSNCVFITSGFKLKIHSVFYTCNRVCEKRLYVVEARLRVIFRL